MAAPASTQNDRPADSSNSEYRSDPNGIQRDNSLADEILQLARSLRIALPVNPQTGPRPKNAFSDASTKTPRFGDLSCYSVSDEDENTLWEIEAARLIDTLQTAPETFNPVHSSTLPSAIDGTGFTSLERVSNQMLYALSIYGLDDSAVIESHGSTSTSPNASIITRSFQTLTARLKTRAETHHVAKVRRQAPSSTPFVPNSSGDMIQKPLSVVAVDDADAPTYYLLVDYITATLARILSAGFHRHQIYWLSIVITVLAKLSTKLKVLSHDLEAFAAVTLERYGNVQTCDNLNIYSAEDNMSNLELDITLSRRVKMTDSSDSYLADYISDMGVVSNWLFRLAWHIITDLNTRSSRGRATDEFEISATVFSAGPSGLSTLVYQNRPGYISGSSLSVAVGMYHRTYELLTNTVTSLKKDSTPDDQMERNQCILSIGTGKPFSDQTFKMRSMADIISIMVVLSCMDPTLMETMVAVCNTIRASTVLPTVYSTVQGYASFASLRNTPPQTNRPPLRDSRPLSESFILQSGSRMLSDLRDRQTTSVSWSSSTITRRELHTSETMRRRIAASARGWAVEEQAISVNCLRYTISVTTGCSILVLGGLMAGFFIGSRIDGVDPFNLTMFVWIIAAFIVVVCKSLRVAEWTWRDFLKGRVTCRSVRELSTVTGLDEQGIIMYLLFSEKELPLKVRGPYNSVFASTDSGGFSVDVKPKIGTLFVSGLVILEVLTENGSALVCIDLRPRASTDASALEHMVNPRRIVHGQRHLCQVLACSDLPEEGGIDKDIAFRKQWISWEKVVGLYDNPSQSVR